jgi:hypothetical protein
VSTLPDSGSGSLPTEYVTFFDSLYLPQGLALYGSLRRLELPFRLTVYAMDDDCVGVLRALDLPFLEVRDAWRTLPHELVSLRAGRDWVSLLWTSTPFVIASRLEDLQEGQALYYVDADMALLRDPGPVIGDFEDSPASVLITAHNFAPEYEAADSVGKFAVQFLGVRRGGSEHVLASWAEQCLRSCPATPQPGAFGDQKYLDDWPRDFPAEVRVAPQPEWFQGPWNATRFPAAEAIAYHFHGLRLVRDRRVLLTTHYRLPSSTVKSIYRPYVQALTAANQLVASTGFHLRDQAPRLRIRTRVRLAVDQARSLSSRSFRRRYLSLTNRPGSSTLWGVSNDV